MSTFQELLNLANAAYDRDVKNLALNAEENTPPPLTKCITLILNKLDLLTDKQLEGLVLGDNGAALLTLLQQALATVVNNTSAVADANNTNAVADANNTNAVADDEESGFSLAQQLANRLGIDYTDHALFLDTLFDESGDFIVPEALTSQPGYQEETAENTAENTAVDKAEKTIRQQVADKKSKAWHETNAKIIAKIEKILGTPEVNLEEQEQLALSNIVQASVINHSLITDAKLFKSLLWAWCITYGIDMATEVGASIVETLYHAFSIDKDTPFFTIEVNPFYYLTQLATLPMFYALFISYGIKYESPFKIALQKVAVGLESPTLGRDIKGFLRSPASLFVAALAAFNALINTGPIPNAFWRRDNQDLIAGLLMFLPTRLVTGIAFMGAALHFAGLMRVYLAAFHNPLLRNPKKLCWQPFPTQSDHTKNTMHELDFTYRLIFLSLFTLTLFSFVLRSLFNGMHIHRFEHQLSTGEQTLPVDADGEKVPTPAWANGLSFISLITQTTYLLSNLSKTAQILTLWLHQNPHSEQRKPLTKQLGLTNLFSSIALACIMSPAIWANPLFATVAMRVVAIIFALIGSIIYSMAALLNNQCIGQKDETVTTIEAIDAYKATRTESTPAVSADNRRSVLSRFSAFCQRNNPCARRYHQMSEPNSGHQL